LRRIEGNTTSFLSKKLAELGWNTNQQPKSIKNTMKLLKKIIAFFLGIIVLTLLTALFTRKDYALTRHTTINKPKEEVFGYLKLLRNSDHFNKWTMVDPKARKTYTGTDGTPGFIYAWNSEETGIGEQQITKIVPGNSTTEGRVEYKIRFIKPFEGVAETHIAAIPLEAGQTKVEWAFASEMMYPMNIVLLFIDMEDFLGKDLDTSLTNLKNLLEKP
jgi:hypothetical protein